MHEHLILAIGLLAAFFTTFAFLPQSIKTIKTKHTKDLSLAMLIMLELGIISWLAYGIVKSDIPIIMANTVTFVFITITLIMKLRYG